MNATATAAATDESGGGGGGGGADEPPLAAALPSSLPRQPSPFEGFASAQPQQQPQQPPPPPPQQQQQQFQQQQQQNLAPLRSPRATPPPPPYYQQQQQPHQQPPPPPPSSSNRPSATDDIDEDDDVVVETDPTGRYVRYDRLVGSGRFKRVYRGFDERAGIDVAWSKVSAERNGLDDEQLRAACREMSVGLGLDHPNVIRCYRCWLDPTSRCVNLVTEFFTSGNLRDYRARHRHLGARAVRKWARQILSGLAHLHGKEGPGGKPIVHGDLRCDKIYINGHSGEIKIGDLGLATLLPTRFAPAVLPDGLADGGGSDGEGEGNQYNKGVDVFAFGLCVLELASSVKVDSSNASDWRAILDERVPDVDARAFIERCLSGGGGGGGSGGEEGEAAHRPTAIELLDDPFLAKVPSHLHHPGRSAAALAAAAAAAAAAATAAAATASAAAASAAASAAATTATTTASASAEDVAAVGAEPSGLARRTTTTDTSFGEGRGGSGSEGEERTGAGAMTAPSSPPANGHRLGSRHPSDEEQQQQQRASSLHASACASPAPTDSRGASLDLEHRIGSGGEGGGGVGSSPPPAAAAGGKGGGGIGEEQQVVANGSASPKQQPPSSSPPPPPAPPAPLLRGSTPAPPIRESSNGEGGGGGGGGEGARAAANAAEAEAEAASEPRGASSSSQPAAGSSGRSRLRQLEASAAVQAVVSAPAPEAASLSGNGGGPAPPPPFPRNNNEPPAAAFLTGDGACQIGAVRGEDYTFQFSGRFRDGVLHFRLTMTWQGEDDDDDDDDERDDHDDDETGDDDEAGENGDGSGGNDDSGSGGGGGARRRHQRHHRRHFKGPKRTVDFAYDPDVDSPAEVASEIGAEFELSPTDKDMCLAAFKELLDSMSLPFEDRE
jgi:WNK lysine deficient protein kinase